MKLKLILATLLAFTFHCAFSQVTSVEGIATDRFTGAPIPYTTIGIKGKAIGSVANEAGRFRFQIPATALSPADSLILSCVGYKESTIAVSAFRAGPQTVTLAPAQVQLGEVVIKSRKVRTRTFGRTGNSAIMVANMFTENNLVSDELGKEQGTIIKVDQEVLLKDFNLHVAFNRFRYVRFRLNIYSVKNNLPDNSLLKEDIVFDVTEPRGWVKVDLSPYQIYLEGHDKVAVTVQWLESEAMAGKKKSFSVSAVPAPGHSILFRDKSQDTWKEVKPGYLSLYLTADSYQGKNRNTTYANAPEKEYTLPDSLKYLRYLSWEEPASLKSSHQFGDSAAVGQFAQSDGARLYYEVYGEGEPLLLLHGNGQSIRSYAQQIAELSRRFKVIAVDTRLHGKSTDAGTGELSYDLFAADMKQLLDVLGLKRVHVLGWSDGGNTALKMALHHPTYVNKIAIMGANLFPDQTAIEPGLLQLFNKQLLATQDKQDEPSRNKARLLRLLLHEPNMTFEDMGKIAVPVLVMAGEHDVILESHTKAIAAHLKDSKLLIFKDASHFAPQEVPDQFNAAVIKFFNPQQL